MGNISGNKINIMSGVSNPAIENFGKLIGSPVNYSVPRFQRDYSWTEDNWNDLWLDVKGLYEGKYTERYMGYLVFHQKDKTNEIIDGQQRLITISLLILAFIENMKTLPDADVLRKISVLKNDYIASERIKRGYFISKLELNENNNDLYHSFISDTPMSRKKLVKSERQMKDCLIWFTERVAELQFKDAEQMGTFVDDIASSFYFSILYVADDLNAYVVFETLNARGVKLSSADLLKNYLFQKVSKDERKLDSVQRKWRELVTIIKSENLIPFIRYFWNSRNPFIRKVDLYREIVSSPEIKDVSKFLDKLIEAAIIYRALNTPSDDYWIGKQTISENLQALKIIGVKQIFVPLLIGKEVLDDMQFEKLLKYCVAFIFRYRVVCDLPPNKEEPFYNNLALAILKNKSISGSDFKELYPREDDFYKNFKELQFEYDAQPMKVVRYILGSIERKLLNNKKAVPLFDKDMTIEHVLSRSNKVAKIPEEEHKKLKDKIGNMTILSRSEQNETKDYPFDIKAPVYQRSEYKITKEIVTTSQHGWNRQSVEQRQEWLCKKANDIWSIPKVFEQKKATV
jgi:uncharacterized protein with ParB-like and HNH nuclease domain